MAAQIRHTPGNIRYLIGKGVHAAVFRRVQPVDLRLMLVVVQGVEHAEHWGLADAGGDQRHRRGRCHVEEEVAVRRGDVDHVAFLRLLVQVVGYFP